MLWRASPWSVAGTSVDRDDRPAALGVHLYERTILQHERRAATSEVAPDPRRARHHREQPHVGAHPVGHRRDQVVVRVEHHHAVGSRDAADDRLHLGQLRQRVDAVEVHVVGADVGQDGCVVRLVADTPQHHAAARGLEDRDIQVRVGEHRSRAVRAGQVARLDEHVVEQDAIRGGRARVSPGRAQDVADHPGGGGLAIGAADADDGHPAVGVPDPGRALPVSASRIARSARLSVRERPGRPAVRRVAGRVVRGSRSRSTSRSAASAMAWARPSSRHGIGHDPDTRLGRAMDAHRDAGTACGRGATLGDQPRVRARLMVERRRSRRRGRPRTGAPRSGGPARRAGPGHACRAAAARTTSAVDRPRPRP